MTNNRTHIVALTIACLAGLATTAVAEWPRNRTDGPLQRKLNRVWERDRQLRERNDQLMRQVRRSLQRHPPSGIGHEIALPFERLDLADHSLVLRQGLLVRLRTVSASAQVRPNPFCFALA